MPQRLYTKRRNLYSNLLVSSSSNKFEASLRVGVIEPKVQNIPTEPTKNVVFIRLLYLTTCFGRQPTKRIRYTDNLVFLTATYIQILQRHILSNHITMHLLQETRGLLYYKFVLLKCETIFVSVLL